MSLLKKFLIFFIVLLVICSCSVGALYFNVQREIAIIGDKEITLELNSEYKELWYEAYILGNDVSSDVKQVSNFDESTIYKDQHLIHS